MSIFIFLLLQKHGIGSCTSHLTEHMVATQSTEARDPLIELKRFSDNFKQEINNLKLIFLVKQERFNEPSHLLEMGCPSVCSFSSMASGCSR